MKKGWGAGYKKRVGSPYRKGTDQVNKRLLHGIAYKSLCKISDLSTGRMGVLPRAL